MASQIYGGIMQTHSQRLMTLTFLMTVAAASCLPFSIRFFHIFSGGLAAIDVDFDDVQALLLPLCLIIGR